MKEIHFYTNLNNIEQTSDWDLETMCTDYVATEKAIEDSDIEIVKTTQLVFLNNAWNYIDKGYRVIIHNSIIVFEIKEKITAPDGKEIRHGHNICKLFCAGIFGKIE